MKTKQNTTSDLVYKLVKLALILLVATASVEHVFSAMKYVKSQLSNKMGDQWLNDRLVTYIERDVLITISNDVILAHFQQMENKAFFFVILVATSTFNIISYYYLIQILCPSDIPSPSPPLIGL